mmetsp:Transcript_5625/g.14241  ORF Transcript_5625/g.14241 Transcript_5625/m.14241 type:complete len:244 (+) Transcript_5625:1506-2237(+)
MLSGLSDLGVVLATEWIVAQKATEGVRTERHVVILDELRPKQLVEVAVEVGSIRGSRWKGTSKVNQIELAIVAQMAFDISSRREILSLANTAAEMRLEVERLSGAGHHLIVGWLTVNGSTTVIRTVHNRRAIDREDAHRNESKAEKVHQCHERHVQLFDAAVPVAHQSLELVAGHLGSRLVIAVHSVAVHCELEQNIAHQIFVSTSSTAEIQRKDGLSMEVSFHDDDTSVGFGGVDKVLTEIQ